MSGKNSQGANQVVPAKPARAPASGAVLPAAWWQRALPDWALPDKEARFYGAIRHLRGFGVTERLRVAGDIKDLSVPACAAAYCEASHVSATVAAPVLRLFKLAKSWEAWVAGLPADLQARGLTIELYVTMMDDPSLVERVRAALIPRKVRALSPAQLAGQAALATLERERKRVLAAFEDDERKLAERLRAVRAEKAAFAAALNAAVPALGALRKARESRLTPAELQRIEIEYRGRDDARDRFTLEGYVAIARANKVAREEASILESFQVLGGTDQVRAIVEAARAGAGAPAAAAAAADAEDISDLLP